MAQKLSPMCDYVQGSTFQQSWLVASQVLWSHFFGLVIEDIEEINEK